MNVPVMQLAFKVKDAPVGADCGSYRPPSWPPPNDWVVSEDAQGNALSRWDGDHWDFSAWAGTTFKLDFAGGRHGASAPVLGQENQSVLRLLATWMIWGTQGPRSWNYLRGNFNLLRRVLVLCDKEGIVAHELGRFPKVIDQISFLITNTQDRTTLLTNLDRLQRDKGVIGLAILDDQGLSRLVKAFAENASEDGSEQTAYMPPRIWTYQATRLRECLDDFLEHKQQVTDCFNFCVDAYAHNFGSLEKAITTGKKGGATLLPFGAKQNRGGRTNKINYGRFEKKAQEFGILELLRKWALSPSGKIDIKSFSLYWNLIQTTAVIYIANFSLQRKEEAASLRTDCLIWEEVPVIGKIAIIRGETTKTDPDSDARWPASPSVNVAVEAASIVSRLRMRCAAANPSLGCTDYDKLNPFLLHAGFEPWASKPWEKDYSIGIKVMSYGAFMTRFPRVFDTNILRITEEDLTKARMFTPNLDKGGAFKVGSVWPLALHQLRRTGGVNMFASGVMSDSSIQVIMKHLTLFQTSYYGRNHSRLRFNEEFEAISVTARYEVLAKQIETLVNDRYISPIGEHRKQEIVNLIEVKDFKKLVKAGKRGEIAFRETRLGGCTKIGHCDYGGIESIARCAGGDGNKPCRDAIFDKSKRPSVERQLGHIERRIAEAQAHSPRERALHAEADGLRRFLDVTE